MESFLNTASVLSTRTQPVFSLIGKKSQVETNGASDALHLHYDTLSSDNQILAVLLFGDWSVVQKSIESLRTSKSAFFDTVAQLLDLATGVGKLSERACEVLISMGTNTIPELAFQLSVSAELPIRKVILRLFEKFAEVDQARVLPLIGAMRSDPDRELSRTARRIYKNLKDDGKLSKWHFLGVLTGQKQPSRAHTAAKKSNSSVSESC